MTTLRAAVGRFEGVDWLIVIGLSTGTAGFALLSLAYGLIFLSLATLGLFIVNVVMEARR